MSSKLLDVEAEVEVEDWPLLLVYTKSPLPPLPWPLVDVRLVKTVYKAELVVTITSGLEVTVAAAAAAAAAAALSAGCGGKNFRMMSLGSFSLGS